MYQITWRSSYAEGLASLRDSHFDVCLLDYRLGEHTGIDLLKDAKKINSVCPIIILTGQGDIKLDILAMQIGAADYLVKGQLTAPLLERAVRYSIKHAFDVQELQDSKAQILQQDRLASLGLLASSLAHEIGTPLGIIRSRAELAKYKADEALQKNMDIVIVQIDKITKLVNSLLHLARSQPADCMISVNLCAVVNDVLNLVQHELDRKGIALNVKSDEDCTVRAEPGHLGQVLLNLLVNAVHAIEESRKNGIERDHAIFLSISQTARSVNISVQDTGCGISTENMSQIFKPFFTTKEIGVGTGLGLATSYKLVKSWGGSLTAESPSGHGALFTISLPK